MENVAFASNELPISSPSLNASLKVFPPSIKKGTSEEGAGERERENEYLACTKVPGLDATYPPRGNGSKQAKEEWVTPLRKQ